MAQGNLTFAKIVATPTNSAWSQAYSAGMLFTALSLKKKEEEVKEEKEDEEKASEDLEQEDGEDSIELKSEGKKILDTLEAEFFTLEEKTLETIKGAITTASSQIPKDLEFSFVAAAVVNNILYVYILGKGAIFIKRGEKFGPILKSEEELGKISAASGLLQNGDLIVLQTFGFSQVLTEQDLLSSLENPTPNDIAEALAPLVHEKNQPEAAAIILSFKESTSEAAAEEEQEILKKTQEEVPSKNYLSLITPYLSSLKEKFKTSKIPLNRSKKMYLTLVIIIFAVLLASIFLAIKRQESSKREALFNSVYAQASKKYDEGKALEDLNKNLARDSLSAAQKILNDNKSKFPTNSKEEKKIEDLSKQVDSELSKVSAVDNSTKLDRSTLSVTVENGSGVEGVAGKAADILKTLGYNVKSTANSDNYNYKGVTIKVKSSKSNFIQLLKNDLSKNYTIGTTSSDLPASSPTDAVIIIGK